MGLAPDLVPYAQGLAHQRAVHADVAAGGEAAVVLLEHESVYTAGRATRPEDRPAAGSRIPVVEVDRGGRITWHGPGQLVGYPIVRLADPIDVVAYVRLLERVIIRAIAPLGVDGLAIAGRSGVWAIEPGGSAPAKVAAIGVRVERGTTLHGFAINADNALDGFAGIVPCGIADAAVTTLSRLAGRIVTTAEVADAVEAELPALEAVPA